MGVKFLLDTSVLLWALVEPGKLSRTALRTIADRNNELLVSSASAWEISTKYRLGKLPLAQQVVTNYEAHLAELGVKEIPISSAHGLLAGSFAVEHRDPFDRMIAAQAVVLSLPILASDSAFAQFPCRVLW